MHRLATLLLLIPTALHAELLQGRATAIDGDSLRLADTEIRLHGIDAPEGRQNCTVEGKTWRCGRAAAETLAMLLQGKSIECEFEQRDSYGRAIATCTRNGLNINATMVEVGMALAYRRYSTRYVAEENTARLAGRGIWDTEFVPPWEWRQQNTFAADCPVKGNVNRQGERIYHTPDSPGYEQVRLNKAQGDRCFDTIDQAQAAGFRAPRQQR